MGLIPRELITAVKLLKISADRLKESSNGGGTVSGEVTLSQTDIDAIKPLATQPISGAVSVSNFPANNSLTNTQLRSAPLAVEIQNNQEQIALNGLIEKNVLKILSRLNFDTSYQLRVAIPAVSGNLTTVTNVTNGGLGSLGLNNTSILVSQQNYYNSFRRNIS